jgi:hypothetical protein
MTAPDVREPSRADVERYAHVIDTVGRELVWGDFHSEDATVAARAILALMAQDRALFASRDATTYADEWQTKAYDCELNHYFIGDQMPVIEPYDLADYQVEILGETPGTRFTDSLATVRGGVLRSIHDERDPSLPRVNYSGHLIEEAQR